MYISVNSFILYYGEENTIGLFDILKLRLIKPEIFFCNGNRIRNNLCTQGKGFVGFGHFGGYLKGEVSARNVILCKSSDSSYFHSVNTMRLV